MKNRTRPEARKRPKTAGKRKPVYLMSMEERAIREKRFNYKKRNFKTNIKKSDPVARINQLKK
jgi:hypothetical protein